MSETKRERYIRILSQLTDCGADMTAEATTEIVDLLKEVPQWIPVSERLPKEGGDYLITISLDIGAEEPIREVYKDYFCVLSQKWLYRDEDVIAWMPLPIPYKESEDKE